MKFPNYYYALLAGLLLFTACSKSLTPSPAPHTDPVKDTTQTKVTPVWESNADIYFVGTFTGVSPNNMEVATVWKNGAPTTLLNDISGSTSNADAIAVNGSDVYVAGFINNKAVFWKNGIFKKIDNSSEQSQATAIAINDGDVYIAGWIGDKAVWWKNGVANAVSNPDTLRYGTFATSIFLAGKDVYMAGYSMSFYQGYFTPMFWKNGIPTNLPITDNKYLFQKANAIAVNGSDVYVVGSTTAGATLWKNGVATALSNNNNSIANTIILKGDDVYIGGYVNEQYVYWKNGTAIVLPESQGAKFNQVGFAIAGSNIYVAGGFNPDKNESKYWRNGIAYPYSLGICLIYGIAVAPH